MSEKTYNVLFLCTGNSARSIMAEAILNRDLSGKFKAFSAGSYPKGNIDPTVLSLLKKTNYPTEGLRSNLGTSSRNLTPPNWISSSPFVTTPLARSARSGPVSR